MSIKEFLKKADTQYLDISPVVPKGVRIITHEKSAAELREERELNNDKPND
jgi:hypothetical protein